MRKKVIIINRRSLKIINFNVVSVYGGNMYIVVFKDIVYYFLYFEYGNKNNEILNFSIFIVLYG